MINLILLIIGDLIICLLQGLYMGVGIRESAGMANISAMSLPVLFFWLILGWLLKIYHQVPRLKQEPDRGSLRRALSHLITEVIGIQRIFRLLIVWICSSLFAVFWQTWYWNNILQRDRGISVRFTLWFCLAGISFLTFWRLAWTVFVIVRVLARRNRFIRALCYLATAMILLYQVPAAILTIRFHDQKYTLQDIDKLPYQTALVFGAGVYQNGEASSVLRDRVNTAVELYDTGKVDRLIMSGDNSDRSRNEVDVMNAIALKAGVPEDDISQDWWGLDTALTCYNARQKFDQESVVVVTQAFHTTRALYTCEHFGLNAVSVAADQSNYNIFSWILWYLRDWAGLTLTWINYEFIQ